MSNSIKWTNIQEELPPHDTHVVFVSMLKPDKAKELGFCIDMFTGVLRHNGAIDSNPKTHLKDSQSLFWAYQDDVIRNSDVLHNYCLDVYLRKESNHNE